MLSLENKLFKTLYYAYKFYLHYFALYIKKNEISADDWNYHKRLERELQELELEKRDWRDEDYVK